MNYKKLSYQKIKTVLWKKIVLKSKNKSYYPKLYKSHWNSLKEKDVLEKDFNNFYFTAIPNPGAGIGHQIANWIAGYWFSKQFELNFAHIPFSSNKWEHFLGFGTNEITVAELVKNQGYKKVKLPLFDEKNQEDIALTRKIIKSYADKKVVFIAEQDQFYKDQIGIIEDIQTKFYNAGARKTKQLVYNQDYFNIAIHVRRGDIVQNTKKENANLTMRWLDNSYFETILEQVLNKIKTDKEVHVYLFSQGKKSDLESFKQFPNLHLCLDMGAMDSFLHMVYADVLITSKSSFSYKPALLNKGIKVCPENFWHGYPKTDDWWMVDDLGNLKN